MKKRFISMMFVTVLMALFTSPALSHCEVPCGIYGDETRFALLSEHIDTMEKAMKQIRELGAAEVVNYNQVVRWTVTKEDHANQFREILVQYFLTQRIKTAEPGSDGYEKYRNSLELIHRMIVHAMKAKQTTDTGHADAMRKLLAQFKDLYTHKHAK